MTQLFKKLVSLQDYIKKLKRIILNKQICTGGICISTLLDYFYESNDFEGSTISSGRIVLSLRYLSTVTATNLTLLT